jgi:hypothetical protein
MSAAARRLLDGEPRARVIAEADRVLYTSRVSDMLDALDSALAALREGLP